VLTKTLIVTGQIPGTKARTLRGPILELKADEGRAIAVVGPLNGDGCREVEVWQPATGRHARVVDRRECAYVFGVALASERVASVDGFGNNVWNTSMHLLFLASGRSITVASASAESGNGAGHYVDNPRGDGALLVYNSYHECLEGGLPEDACPAGVSGPADIDERVVMLAQQGARPIAASARAVTVLAVGGGRVVARLTSGGLIVLAPKRAPAELVPHGGYRAERLVATYPYKPDQVLAAATDGRTLAVLRAGALDVIPMSNGHGRRTTWTLPHATSYGSDSPIDCAGDSGCSATALRLTDLDGNVAVFVRGNRVQLLDLTSGRSVVVARPKASSVDAQLEPDGLYVAADKTLTFTPRDQIERQLHR
jgi:hypothetical protein